jgi:F-type H+-transporting ATPase subunit gamma
MQMVAASRMRRAQEQALASRPYAAKAWEILTHLSGQKGGALHPLLTHRDTVNRVAIIMMTGDKGLAGAYNSNIIRTVLRFMAENNRPNADLIAVGRKGRDLMLRLRKHVVAEFTDMPARPSVLDIAPIARIAVDGFLSGEYDEVYLAYSEFINTLTQRPTTRLLLPLRATRQENSIIDKYLDDDIAKIKSDYLYEPDPASLLDTIIPRFTELQVYQAIHEALASEHSARMVAMRNATENAHSLIGDLTLTYNKARQTAITGEMLDIAGGAEALAKASK